MCQALFFFSFEGIQDLFPIRSHRSCMHRRSLSEEDRAYWEDVAAKDKHRYMVEKATYTGPWQVPWKRAKKVNTSNILPKVTRDEISLTC